MQHRGDAAVDDEDLAVDLFGRGAREVGHQRRHVLGGERVRAVVGRRAHQAGEHGGAGARADGVGADAVPGAAPRGGHGEGGDAGLGGGVVGLARPAEQERLRRRVHDPRVDGAARPLARLPPVRGGQAGGHEVAAQVHADDQVPFFGRHREDHPVPEHPGVVDDDIQPPVLLQRCAHQPLAGRPLADVAVGDHRLAAVRADPLGCLRYRVTGQVVDHEQRPGACQRERLRAPEPVARPGHDGHPAGEAQRVRHGQYPGPHSRPPSATNSLPVE